MPASENKYSKRSERGNSLHPGGSRISSRAIDRTRGTAVSFDGIVGLDGFPTGVQGRGKAQEKREASRGRARRKGKMKVIKDHPICVAWVGSCLFIGVFVQGLVAWLT